MANLFSQPKLSLINEWLGAGSIDIFGFPFAGKDTHGAELAQLFNAPLIGGGEILRQAIIPLRIKNLMSSGKLLPTKDYLEIVLPHLSNASFSGRPLILSSVGRWHGEEAGVLEATAQAGHPLRAVFAINIDETVVWERWKSEAASSDRGRRDDDAADALRVRLDEFKTKTVPVISFYRDEGMLLEIDGKLSREEVLKDMLEQLYSLAKSQLDDAAGLIAESGDS